MAAADANYNLGTDWRNRSIGLDLERTLENAN